MDKKIEITDTIPDYIENFIRVNSSHLLRIIEMESKEKKGYLYMECLSKDDTMNVSYLDESTIYKMISGETWNNIKNKTDDKKVILINDKEIKSIFIFYL